MIALSGKSPEIHLDATLTVNKRDPYDSPSVSLESEIDGEPWGTTRAYGKKACTHETNR